MAWTASAAPHRASHPSPQRPSGTMTRYRRQLHECLLSSTAVAYRSSSKLRWRSNCRGVICSAAFDDRPSDGYICRTEPRHAAAEQMTPRQLLRHLSTARHAQACWTAALMAQDDRRYAELGTLRCGAPL